MLQMEETTSKITSLFGYWVLCITTIFHMAHSFKVLDATNNWNLLEILMAEFFFMDIFNPSRQEVKRGRSRLEHAVNFYDSVVHSWLKTLDLQTFMCGFHKIFLKYRLCCLWGRTGVGWICTGPCMPIKPQALPRLAFFLLLTVPCPTDTIKVLSGKCILSMSIRKRGLASPPESETHKVA